MAPKMVRSANKLVNYAFKFLYNPCQTHFLRPILNTFTKLMILNSRKKITHVTRVTSSGVPCGDDKDGNIVLTISLTKKEECCPTVLLNKDSSSFFFFAVM